MSPILFSFILFFSEKNSSLLEFILKTVQDLQVTAFRSERKMTQLEENLDVLSKQKNAAIVLEQEDVHCQHTEKQDDKQTSDIVNTEINNKIDNLLTENKSRESQIMTRLDMIEEKLQNTNEKLECLTEQVEEKIDTLSDIKVTSR